jgi:hypothetical protein
MHCSGLLVAVFVLACASPQPVPQPPAAQAICDDTGNALQAFFIAWNDRRPGMRSDALTRCCTPHAHFLDPRGAIEGTEALAASVAEFRARYPGALVEFRSPEQHHCVLRVRWTAVLGDGSLPLQGVDFIDLAQDGRFTRVVSFNDLPENIRPMGSSRGT